MNSKFKNYPSFEAVFKKCGINTSLEGNRNKVMIPCPFHEDRLPSCSIDKEKKLFKCFSCGRGGSTLGFYMLWMKDMKGVQLTVDEAKASLGIAFPSRKMGNKIELDLSKRNLKSSAIKHFYDDLSGLDLIKAIQGYGIDLDLTHLTIDDIFKE